MNQSVWLLVVCATYAVLAAAAATVPHIAPHGKEGLAAAATAAVWFLLLGTLALATSIVAMVMTVRAWRRFSVRLRAAGLAPAILSVVGLLALVAALGRSRDETPASPMSPTTVTAPAAVNTRKKQEAEQGVAPQSTTRSESDSEGGDKQQPESEERSP